MFARLEQSGDIEKLHDKWFYPENVHNDTSPMALILLTAIIIAAIVILLFSHMMRIRVKKAVEKSIDMNQLMTEALRSGNYYVIEYDLQSQRLKNNYGDMLPKEGLSHDEFMKRLPDTEKGKFNEAMRLMSQGEKDLGYLKRRYNKGTKNNPDWRWIEGHAVVENEDGKPRYVITSFRDYTHEIVEERINEEIASKYQSMFSNGLIAMSFYAKDGTLIDVNKRMSELCEFDKDGEEFFRKMNLFDVALVKGQYQKGDKESFHVCQRMFYPEIGIFKYIEIKVHPTYDDEGELQFYVVTARERSLRKLPRISSSTRNSLVICLKTVRCSFGHSTSRKDSSTSVIADASRTTPRLWMYSLVVLLTSSVSLLSKKPKRLLPTLSHTTR